MERDFANCPSDNIQETLRERERELENLIETKTAGVIFRSKARWVEQGEKTPNIFLTWNAETIIMIKTLKQTMAQNSITRLKY